MAIPPPISSRANARVKYLRAAFAGDSREGLVAIEGIHLIEEAVRSGISIRTLFVAEDFRSSFTLPSNIVTLHLTRDVFSSAVATDTPQGIAALIEIPSRDSSILDTPDALFLIAAGLQDPGNLGTLIRSAEAFGASGILTTPGTVSPWNQKAIRASAGSVFRLPLLPVTIDELRNRSRNGLHLTAAVVRSGTWPLKAVKGSRGIVIGNEGAGLSEELLSLAQEQVTIPCRVESLNAAIAGSLLLFEASHTFSSPTYTAPQFDRLSTVL